MKRKIGIWGHAKAGLNDGFGYAGFKIVSFLNKMGVETLWEDEDAPIAFSFAQPHNYGGNDHQCRIGYTPWESTIIPDWWVPKMNEMDEMWTTSHFCKDVFNANGVEKDVKIFVHGIDRDEWSISHRWKQDPFLFFHMGEPADRKGGQRTFDAFVKAFGRRKDVFLVFKSNSWVEARWKDSSGSIIGPVDDFPNVQTIKGVLPQLQLDELFSKAHCMVYPSSGEGFGLIPFQAIGTGMPTIMPAWSGMTEFSDFCINVDFSVGHSNHDYHTGDWAWPDVDDLAEKMIYVYENYDEVSGMAYENGMKLREEFRWEYIVEEMMDSFSLYW